MKTVAHARITGLLAAVAFIFAPYPSPAAAAAEELPAWPGGDGTEIGGSGRPDGLDRKFEPSGAVWHPRLQQLLVVDDEGHLARLDGKGSVIDVVLIGGDLEGITLADPDSSLVYLGIEHPDSIAEFDLQTGKLTGQRWDLTAVMRGHRQCGLEGLTFVDGLFYAGHQCEANIYVFELLADGRVNHVDTLEAKDESGLSGLHWDAKTKTLYSIYASLGLMVERTASGKPLRRYALKGVDAEGVAMIPRCPGNSATLFIADDSAGIWRYDDYPIDCPHPLWGPKSAVLAGLIMAMILLILRLHSPRRRRGATPSGPEADVGNAD